MTCKCNHVKILITSILLIIAIIAMTGCGSDDNPNDPHNLNGIWERGIMDWNTGRSFFFDNPTPWDMVETIEFQDDRYIRTWYNLILTDFPLQQSDFERFSSGMRREYVRIPAYEFNNDDHLIEFDFTSLRPYSYLELVEQEPLGSFYLSIVREHLAGTFEIMLIRGEYRISFTHHDGFRYVTPQFASDFYRVSEDLLEIAWTTYRRRE